MHQGQWLRRSSIAARWSRKAQNPSTASRCLLRHAKSSWRNETETHPSLLSVDVNLVELDFLPVRVGKILVGGCYVVTRTGPVCPAEEYGEFVLCDLSCAILPTTRRSARVFNEGQMRSEEHRAGYQARSCFRSIQCCRRVSLLSIKQRRHKLGRAPLQRTFQARLLAGSLDME